MALNLEDPTGGFLDPLGFFDKDKSNPYTSNKAAFDAYAQAMKDAASRYNGYIDRGNQAGTTALDEYNKNIADPNALQDRIASGFNESPYQKYMQDLVTKRLNYNSANSGMQGSGAANRALMEELTKNTGQFQNEYINRGLGVYGQALNGLSQTSELGFRGLNSQDALLQEAAGGTLKGEMGDNEVNDKNRAAIAAREAGMKGNIMGAVGAVAGTYFGGPQGGQAGMQAGQAFGQGSAAGKYQGQQQNMGQSSGGGGFSSSNYQGGGVNTGNWSY
jgi:hypothetical protein